MLFRKSHLDRQVVVESFIQAVEALEKIYTSQPFGSLHAAMDELSVQNASLAKGMTLVNLKTFKELAKANNLPTVGGVPYVLSQTLEELDKGWSLRAWDEEYTKYCELSWACSTRYKEDYIALTTKLQEVCRQQEKSLTQARQTLQNAFGDCLKYLAQEGIIGLPSHEPLETFCKNATQVFEKMIQVGVGLKIKALDKPGDADQDQLSTSIWVPIECALKGGESLKKIIDFFKEIKEKLGKSLFKKKREQEIATLMFSSGYSPKGKRVDHVDGGATLVASIFYGLQKIAESQMESVATKRVGK
jgi:hypothetical protein